MTAYKVVSVRLDLQKNTANVSFGKKDLTIGEISVRVGSFNPPGEQTESELRALAVSKAKQILQDLIAQDPA